jgi:hypothetical protein
MSSLVVYRTGRNGRDPEWNQSGERIGVANGLMPAMLWSRVPAEPESWLAIGMRRPGRLRLGGRATESRVRGDRPEGTASPPIKLDPSKIQRVGEFDAVVGEPSP